MFQWLSHANPLVSRGYRGSNWKKCLDLKYYCENFMTNLALLRLYANRSNIIRLIYNYILFDFFFESRAFLTNDVLIFYLLFTWTYLVRAGHSRRNRVDGRTDHFRNYSWFRNQSWKQETNRANVQKHSSGVYYCQYIQYILVQYIPGTFIRSKHCTIQYTFYIPTT